MKISLWPACVRNHSFQQQVAAASQAGYTHLPIGLTTYNALRKEGFSDQGIIQLAQDHQVQLGHYDGFSDWAPVRFNDDLPDEAKQVFDASGEQCLEICHNLGIDTICATGTFNAGQFPVAQLGEGFGRFCELAASANVQVDLEFLPMWGVNNLQTAWDILRHSQPSKGFLMVDTWHFQRSGSSLELLQSLPSGTVRTAQLADATFALQADTLFEDCLVFRKLPGQGEFELLPILKEFKRQGVDNIGPEIFSAELDLLTANDAAQRCLNATRSCLSQIQWEI